MRLITNGIKHCILNDKSEARKTEIKKGDYSSDDYCRHDFDTTRFIIRLDENNFIGFESALLKTIGFWEKFILHPKL